MPKSSSRIGTPAADSCVSSCRIRVPDATSDDSVSSTTIRPAVSRCREISQSSVVANSPSPSWSADTLTDTQRVRSWIDATNSTTRLATQLAERDRHARLLDERRGTRRAAAARACGCSQRTSASYPTTRASAGRRWAGSARPAGPRAIAAARLAVQVARPTHRHRRLVDLGAAAAGPLRPVERGVGGGEQAAGARPRSSPGPRARSRCWRRR